MTALTVALKSLRMTRRKAKLEMAFWLYKLRIKWITFDKQIPIRSSHLCGQQVAFMKNDSFKQLSLA